MSSSGTARYRLHMSNVLFFVDPSCPWAWVTSRWLVEVAPARDLTITWKSYCIEIRDEYDLAPGFPSELRPRGLAAHELSHRMLRVFEAVRAGVGESAVDALYTEWGLRFFRTEHSMLWAGGGSVIKDCLAACGMDSSLADAQHDEQWDSPILESMQVAYAFAGERAQTPTIVVESDPPYGFKGPVMSEAPTGANAARFWDAIQVIAKEQGFFELMRPRTAVPKP
jgi:hypothetical protein